MAAPASTILIRANAVHCQDPSQDPSYTCKSVFIRGSRIEAISPSATGLDSLIIPQQTRVIDEPTATVLPTFDDTHTHLVFAAGAVSDVPVADCSDLASILSRIRERASTTPKREWIQTAANWQEFNIAEQRLPSRAELDSCSTEHPILVKRGGHNMVLNTLGLEMASIQEGVPVPRGGYVEHEKGLVQDTACTSVFAALPATSLDKKLESYRLATRDYAAKGIGAVRDCFVPIDELANLQKAYEAGALNTRVRVLVSAVGERDLDSVLDRMEPWRKAPWKDHPFLRVWGVKFMIDGGIETAATSRPYNNPETHLCTCVDGVQQDFKGLLLMDKETALAQMEKVLLRGWKVGTHAYGDRGVEFYLDLCEELLRRHPGLPKGSLVMEHGGLADAVQRRRAVRMGIPVTVQSSFLYNLGGVQPYRWGGDVFKDAMPVREWIDEGAVVSAGSDYPVGDYGARLSMWTLSTRDTVAGVQGPEHAVSLEEAVDLHVGRAAAFLGESQDRSSIAVGKLADLAIWRDDPFTATAKPDKETLTTLYTIIDGKVVYESSL
ncbi:uncharacterized protein PG998_012103 [Apiospora kogelbergensis]|uniref:uncharacterized protein n=1 Tax=Apiospora kogelbergensis TaxID=1337665 RepID=UPI00312EC358